MELPKGKLASFLLCVCCWLECRDFYLQLSLSVQRIMDTLAGIKTEMCRGI